jgi:hypothetical protein
LSLPPNITLIFSCRWGRPSQAREFERAGFHGTLVGGGAGNRKWSAHKAARKRTIAAPIASYLSNSPILLGRAAGGRRGSPRSDGVGCSAMSFLLVVRGSRVSPAPRTPAVCPEGQGQAAPTARPASLSPHIRTSPASTRQQAEGALNKARSRQQPISIGGSADCWLA